MTAELLVLVTVAVNWSRPPSANEGFRGAIRTLTPEFTPSDEVALEAAPFGLIELHAIANKEKMLITANWIMHRWSALESRLRHNSDLSGIVAPLERNWGTKGSSP